MFIGFDDDLPRRITQNERERISRLISEKFSATQEAQSSVPRTGSTPVVKPLDYCKACTSRLRAENSKFCAECDKRIAEVEDQRMTQIVKERFDRNRPSWAYLITFFIAGALIALSIQWLLPEANFQRPKSQVTKQK